MEGCTIPVRIGPSYVQLIHMHWVQPSYHNFSYILFGIKECLHYCLCVFNTTKEKKTKQNKTKQKPFWKDLSITLVLYYIEQQAICKHLKEHVIADVCQSHISEQFSPRFIILLGYQNCFSNSPLERDFFSFFQILSEDTKHYWENFWTLLVDQIYKGKALVPCDDSFLFLSVTSCSSTKDGGLSDTGILEVAGAGFGRVILVVMFLVFICSMENLISYFSWEAWFSLSCFGVKELVWNIGEDFYWMPAVHVTGFSFLFVLAPFSWICAVSKLSGTLVLFSVFPGLVCYLSLLSSDSS